MSCREIYQYNNELLFRVKERIDLSFDETVENRTVSFICPKHKVDLIEEPFRRTCGFKLSCPLCEQESTYAPIKFYDTDFSILERKALALLDKSNLKNAKLIRLNDVYTREITKFDVNQGKKSDYFIKSDIKTDINGETIVILYIGYKGKKDKTQFFIKPEKVQLSHDFNDLDPARILAKIELTLKDRTITQNYDESKKDKQ